MCVPSLREVTAFHQRPAGARGSNASRSARAAHMDMDPAGRHLPIASATWAVGEVRRGACNNSLGRRYSRV